MIEKIKNYQINIIAVILGVIIGLIGPLSLLIDKMTRHSYELFGKVYFLVESLGSLYGALLTEFLIFFVAGFVTSLISRKNKLIYSMVVGIITPIIGSFIGGTIRNWEGVLYSILLLTIYSSLGGIFYTKVCAKLFKNRF